MPVCAFGHKGTKAVENTIEKEPRERVVMYLAPALVTQLRRRHADERRPMSRIVEELLSPHFELAREEKTA